MKRAKLDYYSDTTPLIFDNLDKYCKKIDYSDLIIVTNGKKKYDAKFKENSIIIFGSETKGLPRVFIKKNESKPTVSYDNDSRSLNLSNAVSIIAYEAWKSLNFSGEAL